MEKMQHFSIRKLSIGAASVLIGISFLGVKASTVKADALQNASATELTKSKAANEAIEQDISSNIEQEPASKADTKQDTGSDIKQEPVSKTDAKQINNDQPNADQTPAQPVTPKPNSNQQNAADLAAKPQTPAKIKLQSNRTITPNKAGQSKVKVTNLMTTTGKKLNAQMLSASKVVSPTNDTNGGFDEATWGKLDVNDWQGSVQGDYYQLTDYTGDANHVIVPNEADFEKAGISTSGKQVGVTSDLMHTIFTNKANSPSTTVAFSKTDNKIVKAINADWHNTWGHSLEYIYGSRIKSNGKLTKFDGTNLDVSNVTDMSGMFVSNQISDLSPLASWKTDNVTDMSNMFYENQISDLRGLSNWHVNNVTDMRGMFSYNQISDLNPLASWKTDNVTNMGAMFYDNQISNINPLANWNVNNVTDMNSMFSHNQISDLNPLASWKTDNVTNMGAMFFYNQISNINPLANWNVNNVTNMVYMFNENGLIITQAKRVINFIYPAGYAGKKQDSVTQIVDMPPKAVFALITKDSKPSNNILDWVTKTEIPDDSDPIYFEDYTVPEIKGLLEPDKTVISKQQADITKPINVTVTYKLVESNTNDAFALNPENDLHEHANVNANGGYDEDYWGKLNINDWNYTTNDNTITITGYKGNNLASLIIPNGADFDLANGRDVGQSNVEISSSVMHDLAKNATRIGLSKTANKKVIAKDAIWQDAFGGMTNEPGTDSNANGGIKYGSPNLTQMDLHNLDTSAITNMSALFNGGSNLTTVGDLSDWNTSNVTNMRNMFQTASSLINIGNLDNWDTRRVTDMTSMFGNVYNLTNIGDLSKWQTGNVTDMNNMFANATNLTNIGNLDDWNTSKVTDMSWMFGTDTGKQSHLINIGDLSKWQTGNVTDMQSMFSNTTSLTNIGDLSKWQTGNVTDMHNMFANATSLTNIGNLDNWDTNKVTDMRWMFGTDYGKQSHLTNIGDLSKWQTGNVTDMHNMFSNATSLTNIGDLSKWQTGNVTDMQNMFYNATSLTNIGNLDNWDTNKVTDMSWMFGTDTGKQSHLTNIGDLSKWQTGNVTDMHNMFANATSLTNIGNLDNWDTNKVTDMRWMFGGTTSLTNIGDLSKWQTGNVTDMHNMFYNATSLTNIGNLDNWDTNKVTDMSWMFRGTTSLTNIGDLSKWQTGNVTDMNGMFANATSLTNIGNLDNWDTSKVTDMHLMFGADYSKQSHLTHIGDLSKWDTSHVTDMNNMFANKALLNLNISNWNLTKLANKDAMKCMFANVTNLTVIANNLKLPTWYENEINNADYFWNNHIAVITNVPELIRATGDINNLRIDDQDGSRSIFYDSKGSSDAIQVLKDANNQYIADYHKAKPTKFLKLADTVDQNDPIALANASFKLSDTPLPVLNTNDAYALDSKNGLHEHANVNDNGGYDADFWGKINVDDWNYTVSGDRIEINSLKDGTSTGANDAVIVPNLDDFKLAGKDGGAKTVYISSSTLGKTAKHKYYGLSKTNGNTFATNSNLAFAFYNNSNFTHADLNSLDTSNVTNMDHMFDGASGLTSLDVSNWNTGKVTDMDYMFYGASGLTSLDVSNWDTRNVTDMNTMFASASGLTSLDVSNWNTGKVTDMRDMFGSARSLTSLNVSNWDTSNVTKMAFMFYGASGLTSLDVSNWDTSNVTNMNFMFDGASNLTTLDVSNWDTSKVTAMSYMFNNASSLTSLDVSNWNTSKVTDMDHMFNNASSLTSLDVSNWKTGNVTDMYAMFYGASRLTSLDVSKWDISNVTDMRWMFGNTNTLALIVNGNKFADYLVKNNFANSKINSNVKSVTTDNEKLLQLLTNDSQHDSATRTIIFTFPANYSPDLAKYHLTKNGNTYQIKQSADYDKSYVQGTVLINATSSIAKHHIDTTKRYKLSDTWQPNYDKLVLAHKNSDGSVSFDKVQLPQIPGYKTVASLVNPARALFAVSFMALPKPIAPAINDVKPAETVSPATPVAIEVAKPIKTEPKVAVTPKVIDLSNDVVATTPDVSTWHVADEPSKDTYRVSNGQYAVELPHISNAQLHVIANDSTKDTVLFTYKGQNSKYAFKIKFVNGHYLLTTYKIKSGKLVKLIDYNFIKSSKMIDVIVDWIKLK